jgi:hypothetical protein
MIAPRPAPSEGAHLAMRCTDELEALHARYMSLMKRDGLHVVYAHCDGKFVVRLQSSL